MNELVRTQEFSDFQNKLAEFRNRYDGVVYDLTDPKQNKQARSDRFQIGKVIGNLDRAHKDIKAPLLEQVRLVDGERKHLKDDLLGVQGRIKAQLEEHEARLKAAEEAVQKRIDAIAALAAFENVPSAADIRASIAVLEGLNPEAGMFEPRQADATLAVRQVGRKLTDMLAQRIAYEKEQAELQRQRAEAEARERQEREDRIRKEGEEKAKREAEALARKKAEEAKRREQAIREEKERAEAEAEAARRAILEQKAAAKRREAEEAAWREQQLEKADLREKELKKKAARDKAEAEQWAQAAAKEAAERAAQAERERAERRQQQKDAAAEVARKEAERKAANKAHREAIEKDIKKDILSLTRDGPSESTIFATDILEALKAGKISHVRIVY